MVYIISVFYVDIIWKSKLFPDIDRTSPKSTHNSITYKQNSLLHTAFRPKTWKEY